MLPTSNSLEAGLFGTALTTARRVYVAHVERYRERAEPGRLIPGTNSAEAGHMSVIDDEMRQVLLHHTGAARRPLAF